MRALFRGLVQNWQLKLLAFALAVLLWIINSAEQVTSQWIPVPLQVSEEDPDFQLMSASVPAEVRVRFTGSGRDLIDAAIRKPPVLLSIGEVDEARQAFRLDPDMVQVPGQLAVNAQDIEPRAIQLRFLRLDRRAVPVEVALAPIPPGFTLADSLQVQPSRVEVRGAGERVAEVAAVRTATLDLAPSEQAFSQLVPLDTSGLSGVTLSARRVRVSGRIERVTERTVSGVPVSAGPGINIRPASVNVRLIGPRSRVQALRASDFRVIIAVDSIPSQLPAEGVPVPLRIESLDRRVRAVITPPAVRLLPSRLPQDTVAVPRPERDARGATDGAAQ